jgi:hypothetical protein
MTNQFRKILKPFNFHLKVYDELQISMPNAERGNDKELTSI